MNCIFEHFVDSEDNKTGDAWFLRILHLQLRTSVPRMVACVARTFDDFEGSRCHQNHNICETTRCAYHYMARRKACASLDELGGPIPSFLH
jgi:hypothetical protein